MFFQIVSEEWCSNPWMAGGQPKCLIHSAEQRHTSDNLLSKRRPDHLLSCVPWGAGKCTEREASSLILKHMGAMPRDIHNWMISTCAIVSSARYFCSELRLVVHTLKYRVFSYKSNYSMIYRNASTSACANHAREEVSSLARIVAFRHMDFTLSVPWLLECSHQMLEQRCSYQQDGWRRRVCAPSLSLFPPHCSGGIFSQPHSHQILSTRLHQQSSIHHHFEVEIDRARNRLRTLSSSNCLITTSIHNS